MITTRRLLLPLILLLVAVPAFATVLVPADVGELTRAARAVARGRVVRVDARWSDDHRSIETLVTLDVDSYLKGALGATVQFRVPGGQLGRYRSVFVGAPEFGVGDYVVVFLGAQGPAIPYVLGLNQGVFRLTPANGRGSMVRSMTLDAFERQVRALSGEQR